MWNIIIERDELRIRNYIFVVSYQLKKTIKYINYYNNNAKWRPPCAIECTANETETKVPLTKWEDYVNSLNCGKWYFNNYTNP